MSQVAVQAVRAKRPLDVAVITLFSIITLSTLIAVPWFGIAYGYTVVDWVSFVILYAITGLGITVGYHRLITHRSFTCPAPVKIALLIAGGMAMENSALKWSSDHLRHHARTDTDDDPYDATRGFWYSHCGWLMFKRDPKAYAKYKVAFEKDPLVMWQHRWYFPVVSLGIVIPIMVGFISGGLRGAVGCFLLAGMARIFLVLNSTFCINSICHLFGDQPYGDKNTSRNSFWISLITFGEGYHNYHHAFPTDFRNGSIWYNFDPSKWLIFGLSVFSLSDNLYTNRTD